MAIQSTARHRGLRHWLYLNLEPRARRKAGLSWLNRFLALMICAAVGFAVMETEPTVATGNESIFRAADYFFTSLFLIEYLARAWITPENSRYGPGWRGRMRYLVSPAAVIDLAALLPSLLSMVSTQAYLLRMFRLVRILRLAKLGRFSTALHTIATAVHSRRYELLMSLTMAIILLLVSSTLLYMIESDIQPDAFGSIPRAMWWSIATLTTVGYGDVYPHTPLGKILAACTAITGIGLIAMPTGILAAAFSDALQKQREAKARAEHETEEGKKKKSRASPASRRLRLANRA